MVQEIVPTAHDEQVYIVDDEAHARSALTDLLRSVGIASRAHADAHSFLTGADSALAGCLLVDVRLPGLSGLELVEEMTRRLIRLPAIVISGYADVRMAVRAMKAGAFDFVEKPYNEQDLLETIQAALKSDRQSRAERREVEGFARRYMSLSPREHEVLELIIEGRLSKQIAVRLGISEKTVEIHRSNVMRKLATSGIPELVRYHFLMHRVLPATGPGPARKRARRRTPASSEE